jgi:hypothetical protein
MSEEYARVRLFNQVHLKKRCSRESNSINGRANVREIRTRREGVMVLLLLLLPRPRPGLTKWAVVVARRRMKISRSLWISCENLHSSAVNNNN